MEISARPSTIESSPGAYGEHDGLGFWAAGAESISPQPLFAVLRTLIQAPISGCVPGTHRGHCDRASRKPSEVLAASGHQLSRVAERHEPGLKPQAPPRTFFTVPESGPAWSTTAEDG